MINGIITDPEATSWATCSSVCGARVIVLGKSMQRGETPKYIGGDTRVH